MNELKNIKWPQVRIEIADGDAKNGTCKIMGWCAAPSHVSISIKSPDGDVIEGASDRYQRPDINEFYKGVTIDKETGFNYALRGIKTGSIKLTFSCNEGEVTQTVYMGRAMALLSSPKKYLDKTVKFVKNNGITALPKKLIDRLKKQDRPLEYMDWLPAHVPTKEELLKQKNTKFDYEPKFSIVVPLYKTPEKFLRKLVDSVKSSTYANWELCLSDGSGENSPLTDILAKLTKEDERIKVIGSDKNLRIAPNTNNAISIATGDYIIFADHDDEITADALFECAKALNENKELDVIYTDEDKVDGDNKLFFEPHMKPEFNLDLLRSVNYICHMFVVRKTLLEKTGLLDENFDGAQDYDFVLRCIENTKNIKRIPKVLYHWRVHEESTAANPESKAYAFDAGRRALLAHYDRVGIKAEVIEGEYPGLYRTVYKRDSDPLISIIIPNKDHKDDLKKCIDSLMDRSTYRNFEIIVVENNSELEDTFAFYKELEAANDKVKVVYYEGGFNYSKINNFGEKYASGEYLLLLNNDIEMLEPDSIEDMLGFAMRSDVGAVGARLYFEDDTIQHAGVVIGYGGIAGHAFVNQPKYRPGYAHRITCAQNYSAVTAACMLVDRKVYNEVGGLTETFAVAFNDVDLCMKITKAGYLIVYDPYAVLYHYESKSRGYEDTPEKKARFAKEIALFKSTWPDIIKNGDPYYNPNLTLKAHDFSLKRD